MPTPYTKSLIRRVVARHLMAAKEGSILPRPLRQKVNAALIRAGMDGNKRFRTVGASLARISEVLSLFGIEWDQVINSHSVRQPKGRISVYLATSTDDPFSPISIQNTALAFHWDTLENGVEVIAYLG